MSFLLYQLADSAFPTGGFAHSGGLEASVQAGEVSDIAAWLRDAIVAVGHGSLPFLSATYAHSFTEVDAASDAFIVNTVAHRASRTQGRALLDTCRRIFQLDVPRAGHHAPAFGVCAQKLGVREDDARRVFLHLSIRGLASAAVRLGVLGPHRAQAVHFELHDHLERIAASKIPMSDAAWTAPLQELFGGTHDRLYSRLFQS
jgi:urease accessory protein